MECYTLQPHHQFLPQNLMLNPLISLSSKLKPKPQTTLSNPFKFRQLCTLSSPIEPIKAPNEKPSKISKEKTQLVKENWLTSLSHNGFVSSKENAEGNNGGSQWVIGVDPDVSGALALLKCDDSGVTSAEVLDNPFVQVSVGKRLRKRLDARSIVQMLQNFDAPNGTVAYLEQSVPFPQDGKLGWWSGGFGYGLWIGVLVASGFSVVPVPSSVWKKEFELARSSSSKDDSRELAKQLFPDLSPLLERKKDHGRAEALLIAAYGKGHKIKSGDTNASDMVLKLDQTSCETAMLDGVVTGVEQLQRHELHEMEVLSL